MNTDETIIVDENDTIFFKKSPRVLNNTKRRMETPDTYLIDKRGRLWRPKNAIGSKLVFSKEGGANNDKFILPMTMYNDTDLENNNHLLNEFNKVIKKIGDIFLLGYPTNDITMLMMKLYHENIVRIQKGNKTDLVKFMTGLLQIKGTDCIYVTISESEREGMDYDKKFLTFYSLLKNSGCFVEQGEDENFDFGTPIQWTKTGENDFDETTLPRIKDYIFIDETNQYNYSCIVKKYPIKVKLIHNYKYIENREKGVSFMPFKNSKKDNFGNTITNCVYGSLCVEAKLFDFVYNLGYTYKDIDGFIAYWIDNGLPPDNHYYDKYSYSKNNKIEEDKLHNMFSTTFGLLNENTKQQLTTACEKTIQRINISFDSEERCKDIFEFVIEPISLTCPGCYMNSQMYVNNIRGKWDTSSCHKYYGGRRKTKKKLNKRANNIKGKRKTFKKK